LAVRVNEFLGRGRGRGDSDCGYEGGDEMSEFEHDLVVELVVVPLSLSVGFGLLIGPQGAWSTEKAVCGEEIVRGSKEDYQN
jgi:hypothetical protein